MNSVTECDDIYSRANLLSWANEMLSTSHSSLHHIPAQRIALLLRSILVQRRDALHSETTSVAGSPDSADVEAFLSLNGIQFTSDDSQSNSRVEGQNLKFLLQWIIDINQKLEESNQASLQRQLLTPSRSASTSPAPTESPPSPLTAAPTALFPVISLTQSVEETANQWLSGTAFVEELKVWRWMRGLVHSWDLPEALIVEGIHDFLNGYVPAVLPSANLAITPSHKRPREGAEGGADLSATGLSSFGLFRKASGQKTIDGVELCHELEKAKSRLETAQALAPEKPEGNGDGVPQPVGANASLSARAPNTLETALPCHKATALVTEAPHSGQSISWDILLKDPRVKRDGGEVNAAVRAASTASCTECPLVVAQAIQSNLSLIEQMERARLAAIEACLHRDASALLAALSHIA